MPEDDEEEGGKKGQGGEGKNYLGLLLMAGLNVLSRRLNKKENGGVETLRLVLGREEEGRGGGKGDTSCPYWT